MDADKDTRDPLSTTGKYSILTADQERFIRFFAYQLHLGVYPKGVKARAFAKICNDTRSLSGGLPFGPTKEPQRKAAQDLLNAYCVRLQRPNPTLVNPPGYSPYSFLASSASSQALNSLIELGRLRAAGNTTTTTSQSPRLSSNPRYLISSPHSSHCQLNLSSHIVSPTPRLGIMSTTDYDSDDNEPLHDRWAQLTQHHLIGCIPLFPNEGIPEFFDRRSSIKNNFPEYHLLVNRTIKDGNGRVHDQLAVFVRAPSIEDANVMSGKLTRRGNGIKVLKPCFSPLLNTVSGKKQFEKELKMECGATDTMISNFSTMTQALFGELPTAKNDKGTEVPLKEVTLLFPPPYIGKNSAFNAKVPKNDFDVRKYVCHTSSMTKKGLTVVAQAIDPTATTTAGTSGDGDTAMAEGDRGTKRSRSEVEQREFIENAVARLKTFCVDTDFCVYVVFLLAIDNDEDRKLHDADEYLSGRAKKGLNINDGAARKANARTLHQQRLTLWRDRPDPDGIVDYTLSHRVPMEEEEGMAVSAKLEEIYSLEMCRREWRHDAPEQMSLDAFASRKALAVAEMETSMTEKLPQDQSELLKPMEQKERELIAQKQANDASADKLMKERVAAEEASKQAALDIEAAKRAKEDLLFESNKRLQEVDAAAKKVAHERETAEDVKRQAEEKIKQLSIEQEIAAGLMKDQSELLKLLEEKERELIAQKQANDAAADKLMKERVAAEEASKQAALDIEAAKRAKEDLLFESNDRLQEVDAASKKVAHDIETAEEVKRQTEEKIKQLSIEQEIAAGLMKDQSELLKLLEEKERELIAQKQANDVAADKLMKERASAEEASKQAALDIETIKRAKEDLLFESNERLQEVDAAAKKVAHERETAEEVKRQAVEKIKEAKEVLSFAVPAGEISSLPLPLKKKSKKRRGIDDDTCEYASRLGSELDKIEN